MELIRPLQRYSNKGKAAPHLKPHSWGSGRNAVGFPNLGNRWRQFYAPADLPQFPFQSRMIYIVGLGVVAQAILSTQVIHPVYGHFT